ncbi:MAG: SMC-Scp complex subunit ScpB [Patescibacteria group bacterium]|nr:SMC-Scp complex subunit ScpB [Patescibacteria group bacterium]
MAQVEALLLLAREPLSSRKLAQLAGLADGTKARTLVRALNSRYDSEGCAFRAEEVAGGFQLLTRPQFAPWLRRLDSMTADVRLSAPAMETLAVVAYRQPVLRADVEAVRGVQCGEILRQLIERDLVRVTGRSDDLGRPLLYGTTRRFLQVFGLRHLDELPRQAAVSRPGSESSDKPPSFDRSSSPLVIFSENASEESKVTTLTHPKHEPIWHDCEHPFQDPELLSDALCIADEEEEDFDVDEDLDDDEEEEEEDEEEELDDDLEDEPWEEVDDEEDEEEEEEEEEWDDEDELDDEDDDWDDDEEEDEEEWEDEAE